MSDSCDLYRVAMLEIGWLLVYWWQTRPCIITGWWIRFAHLPLPFVMCFRDTTFAMFACSCLPRHFFLGGFHVLFVRTEECITTGYSGISLVSGRMFHSFDSRYRTIFWRREPLLTFALDLGILAQTEKGKGFKKSVSGRALRKLLYNT